MNKKELLMRDIEKERRKLNGLLKEGTGSEEAYLQSLVLDRLIEQYMDLTAGCA